MKYQDAYYLCISYLCSWIVLQGVKLIKDAFNEPGITARSQKEASKFIAGDIDGMTSYVPLHSVPLHSHYHYQGSLLRKEGFGLSKGDFTLRPSRDFGFGKNHNYG
jgi:hypothetical protein